MKREALILAEVRQAVNLSGKARLVRNSVGFDLERKIRYGLGRGSADLVGILLDGSARLFCLEAKSAKGRSTKEQAAWASVVRKHGGFCADVRSVDEALAAVERALKGERQ